MNLKSAVTTMLITHGIAPGKNGFGYLRDLISLYHGNENEYAGRFTKKLYPEVGAMNKTTGTCVERSARYSYSESRTFGHLTLGAYIRTCGEFLNIANIGPDEFDVSIIRACTENYKVMYNELYH